MRARLSPSFICALALLLSGCNEAQPVAAAPPPARPSPAAEFARLPAGAACTAKIHSYQAVLGADVRTGNLEQKVYVEIERELALAAADCADGLGRQALQLVHDSEVRHGYHV